MGAKNKSVQPTPYLLSIVCGVIIGLIFHKGFATYFNAKSGLDYPFGSTAAFFLLVMLGAILFYAVLILFHRIDDKKAENVYELFRRANIFTFAIIAGVLFCLLSLLANELPINGLSFMQKQTDKSKVTQITKKIVQGSGIDFKLIQAVSLSNTESSEEIVPLTFRSTTIKFDQKTEYEMLDKINVQRKEQGLEALIYDNALANVARDHSIDMMNKRYFAHINLSGETPFDRLHTAKINYTLAGENLAVSDSTEHAVTALMNSPTHRANILNKDFHKTGIGIAINQDGVLVISQEFTN